MLDFTKSDYRALATVAWVAIVVAPLLLVGIPLWAWMSGDGITRDVVRESGATSIDSAAGTEASIESVVVTLLDPGVGVRLADLAAAGVVAAAAIAVGTALLQLSTRTRAGEPFDDVSVAALRRISLVLIFAPPLQSLVDSTVVSALGSKTFGEDGFIGVSLGGSSVALIFVGVGMGVLAEAFRHGQRLRHDTEGLV